MPIAPTPLPRLALNLLLAFAMLLQAGAAVAMRTSMVPAPPVNAAAANDLAAGPPCHAMAAAASEDLATESCCDDGASGFCQWACAHAFSMAPVPALPIHAPLERARYTAPVIAAPLWHTVQILRPPIA